MMIETNASSVSEEALDQRQALVLGVGGAGCNIVDHFSDRDSTSIQFVAIDSDAQCLLRLHNCEKMQIGQAILHGFGAGSNAELARLVGEKECSRLKQLLSNRTILFVVAGLGGGIGSELSLVIVQLASEAKIFTVVLAIQPFDCEGHERGIRSQLVLEKISKKTPLVISLPNQLLAQQSSDNTDFYSLYSISNKMVAQAVQWICFCLFNPCILPLDIGTLRNTFSMASNGEVASLAMANADGGEKRIETIWNALLKHPWLRSEKSLSRIGSALVLIICGRNFSLQDVEEFRSKFNSENPAAKVIIGVCMHPSLGWNEVQVVLITSPKRIPERVATTLSYSERASQLVDDVAKDGTEKKRLGTRRLPQPPELNTAQEKNVSKLSRSKKSFKYHKDPNQGELNLGISNVEITSVGRFDSCEKTFFHEQPLDVPTFIRWKIKLK